MLCECTEFMRILSSAHAYLCKKSMKKGEWRYPALKNSIKGRRLIYPSSFLLSPVFKWSKFPQLDLILVVLDYTHPAPFGIQVKDKTMLFHNILLPKSRSDKRNQILKMALVSEDKNPLVNELLVQLRFQIVEPRSSEKITKYVYRLLKFAQDAFKSTKQDIRGKSLTLSI